MRLYIDTDSNTFVTDPAYKAPVYSVPFKRGDGSKVSITFLTGNTPLSADPDRRITFGIKRTGDYEGPFLVAADTFTVNGDQYILSPSFNTTELNNALNHNSLSGDDIVSVTGMLEVTTSTDFGASWTSTNTIEAVIRHDVISGDEGGVTDLPDAHDWFMTEVSAIDGPVKVVAPNLFTAGGGIYNLANMIMPTDSASVYLSGYGAIINNAGLNGSIKTTNYGGVISTAGQFAHIRTEGNDSNIFTAGDTSQIYTCGESSNISTRGLYSSIYTCGNDSYIYTTGECSSIATIGVNSCIYAEGVNSKIFTCGDMGCIYTSNVNSHIYTESDASPIKTLGSCSPISTCGICSPITTYADCSEIVTYGQSAGIFTQGGNSPIATSNNDSPIVTSGAHSPIFTAGEDSHITTNHVTSNIGARTDTPTQALDINSDSFRLRNTKTVATSSLSGEKGTIAFDANYIYIAVDTNTWKRAALSNW